MLFIVCLLLFFTCQNNTSGNFPSSLDSLSFLLSKDSLNITLLNERSKLYITNNALSLAKKDIDNAYAIFKSSHISNYLALSYFFLFCLVGYYVYILFFGPKLPTIPYSDSDFSTQIPSSSSLLFHVVSQKLVIYGIIFSTLWQLIELRKKKYVDLID